MAQRVDTYNPSYETARFTYQRPPRRFGTSPTELLHLTVAVLVLSGAIVLYSQSSVSTLHKEPLVTQIVVALGIAITGFALHEVAHKITAQHYGHWSEFRFSVAGLLLTALAAFMGVLVGAPGATWHTATSPRDNGRISAAGPLLNLFMALFAFPFTSQINPSRGLVTAIADHLLLFNAILAAFNLLPIGPLDGRKILRWNVVVYGILVGCTALLFIYAQPWRIAEKP